MTSKRSITDEMAVNWIFDILTEEKISFKALQKISQVIQFTGREIPNKDIEGK
jgi:hypothetical protein